MARSAASKRRQRGKKDQAVLLRNSFGNPCRPVAIDATWRTPTVTAAAQTSYDQRRFTNMPNCGSENR